MRLFCTIVLSLTFVITFGQSTYEWSASRNLNLSDYTSPQTKVNATVTTYSITPGASIDFSFSMSYSAFMFTKNFNKKVKTVFNKNAAAIIAPDSTIAKRLLKLGQYQFDLTELYSRKLRKEIYEKKRTFSGLEFFKPIFDTLKNELNAENTRVFNSTNFGEDETLLKQEHDTVLQEIENLSAFCFHCKPPKKKKKKNKGKQQ